MKITEIQAAGECFHSCLELSPTLTIVSAITLKNRRDVSNFLQENYQSKASFVFL